MADISSFIKTIIVVMMENRSFDHLLGSLRLPGPGCRTDVDGLTSPTAPAYTNIYQGVPYSPFEAPPGPLATDLPHERDPVKVQLDVAPAVGRPTMRGFADAYFKANPENRPAKAPPMGFQTSKSAPVSQFLAREFLLCDRWFSSIPTSTQPNRLMAYSGYSRLDKTRSWLLPDQYTFADWADDRGIGWRCYHKGFSFLGLFEKMLPKLALPKHFRNIRELALDLKDLSTPFPEIVWAEPAYEDAKSMNGSVPACDNHPPLGIEPGEQFLQEVYEAVRQSPRWNETLLIVTYDEHGGFFDHVPPPPAVTNPPPGASYPPFGTLGVRVPAILISPHVMPHGVFGTTNVGPERRLDHTSILQIFADCFDGGKDYSLDVAGRKNAASLALLAEAVQPNARATAAPPAPASPVSPAPAVPMIRGVPPGGVTALTPNSEAFMAAARELARFEGANLKKTHPAVANWVDIHHSATIASMAQVARLASSSTGKQSITLKLTKAATRALGRKRALSNRPTGAKKRRKNRTRERKGKI